MSCGLANPRKLSDRRNRLKPARPASGHTVPAAAGVAATDDQSPAADGAGARPRSIMGELVKHRGDGSVVYPVPASRCACRASARNIELTGLVEYEIKN